jgi:hypothetical protein
MKEFTGGRYYTIETKVFGIEHFCANCLVDVSNIILLSTSEGYSQFLKWYQERKRYQSNVKKKANRKV